MRGAIRCGIAALSLAGAFAVLPANGTGRKVEAVVHHAAIPVLTERSRNVTAELCLRCEEGLPAQLDAVEVRISGLPAAAVRSVRLIHTGTMSALMSRSTSWAMRDAFRRLGGGQQLHADPMYASERCAAPLAADGSVRLHAGQRLVEGPNYFYVSVEAEPEALGDLAATFSLDVVRVEADGAAVDIREDARVEHRFGVGVRQHGDDGVYAYRIPGLVTTPAGTLLAVYDVRHRTSLDLQENIDVGVSRSTDGGRTWEPMRIVLDMGCYGGLPEAQNGVGDPSILVDDATGDVFVVAAWTHGLGNDRAWTSVGQGFEPIRTAQLVMTCSRDDGRTWSAPVNVTRQVKRPEWAFTLQGPGRGISMADGTLVFPIQYIDSLRVPGAGVMYSIDRGETWRTHGRARSNTTESQVAEVAPGRLMLNMRDNRKTGRAVCISDDLGRTWREHPSSGALREPVCMASLLHVPARDNVLGRDVLLFSNPDTTKGRNHLTVRASLDGGDTWLPANKLLLDEEESWGYSCLSMVDRETVGILYEGSTAQLVFQAVRLRDIVRDTVSAASWRPMPGPVSSDADFAQGVSALYAGCAGRTAIAAGGANFPDVPAAEGGAKRFYDAIHLQRDAGGRRAGWIPAGRLPEPAAYGASYSLPQEVVVAGGANASGPLRSVYALRPHGSRVTVRRWPDLPFAVEQGAAATDGGVLYLVGGLADGKPSRAVLACDTERGDRTWRVVATMPEPFVQPVAAVHAGVLYVWGGFDPERCAVADYGYRCDLGTGRWERIEGLPDGGTMTGAAAAALPDGTLFVAGGVDREVFASGLRCEASQLREYLSRPPAAYRFRASSWRFDPRTERWSEAGVSGRSARAGAALVATDDGVMLLGGETRPGIRTPDAWFLKFE